MTRKSTPDDWYWYCFELAGIIGIDPGPRTLAELAAMAKGHERAVWERTALLAAIGANPYRDTKKHKKPFMPDDFNPFADRVPNVERKKLKISVACLKGLCQQEQRRNTQ